MSSPRTYFLVPVRVQCLWPVLCCACTRYYFLLCFFCDYCVISDLWCCPYHRIFDHISLAIISLFLSSASITPEFSPRTHNHFPGNNAPRCSLLSLPESIDKHLAVTRAVHGCGSQEWSQTKLSRQQVLKRSFSPKSSNRPI
ncbi:hypothetical protein EDB81DRAFT_349296 [Dactylonectria macrodidyma]|uniref:Uncharacterized protein n=1 Tax=Dactylonectria macrodidyma TaxID=307937 RepID=A0A9P9FH55_9HYPO|nr:hypothetical protein EDB81DRAFT_349296 [Dactylonectria macrodidyma]